VEGSSDVGRRQLQVALGPLVEQRHDSRRVEDHLGGRRGDEGELGGPPQVHPAALTAHRETEADRLARNTRCCRLTGVISAPG
jgi:hypothetical protein